MPTPSPSTGRNARRRQHHETVKLAWCVSAGGTPYYVGRLSTGERVHLKRSADLTNRLPTLELEIAWGAPSIADDAP